MPDPAPKRNHRPTPMIVLKRLRRSAGQCPGCHAEMTACKDVAAGERATYACGSSWFWFGVLGRPRAGKPEVSCGKQPETPRGAPA